MSSRALYCRENVVYSSHCKRTTVKKHCSTEICLAHKWCTNVSHFENGIFIVDTPNIIPRRPYLLFYMIYFVILSGFNAETPSIFSCFNGNANPCPNVSRNIIRCSNTTVINDVMTKLQNYLYRINDNIKIGRELDCFKAF